MRAAFLSGVVRLPWILSKTYFLGRICSRLVARLLVEVAFARGPSPGYPRVASKSLANFLFRFWVSTLALSLAVTGLRTPFRARLGKLLACFFFPCHLLDGLSLGFHSLITNARVGNKDPAMINTLDFMRARFKRQLDERPLTSTAIATCESDK